MLFRSAATIWGYNTNVASIIHTNGAKILLTTVTYTGTYATDVILTNLNAMILTNWQGTFDGVINLNADPRIGQGALSGANPYFYDSLHENNSGYEAELPIYRSALQKVLTP